MPTDAPPTAVPAGHEPEPEPPAQAPVPRRLLLATAAVFAAALVAGWLTRDFGHHWDERFQVQMVQRTARTGSFLPHWYRYPSVTYWLSLASVAPAAAAAGFDGEAVAAEAETLDFKLRGRWLFWTVSHLALFWVACLAWRATRSPPGAFLAVLALALSFEFHYHARWMTSDTINAQFVALAALGACAWLARGGRALFAATAVTAGLAMGSKYPGGLALLPLGLAILYRAWDAEPGLGERLRRSMNLGLAALAITLATFLATTPGAVLDGDQFWKHIEQELRHYSERGHMAYTIEPGLPHLSRMLGYLAFSGLSFQPAVAVSLFALALIGAAALARRDRRIASLLVALPVVYLLYFSRQRVMTVRNLQVLMPFLAVLAACGVHAVTVALRPPFARRAALAVLALALGWNAVWLVRADRSIVRRDAVDLAAEVTAFVRSSEAPVFLGRGLRAELGAEVVLPLVEGGLVTTDIAAAERAVVFVHDIPLPDKSARDRFIANRRGTYDLLPSGPWEVHWDYYPTWAGDRRPIVISSAYFRDLAGKP